MTERPEETEVFASDVRPYEWARWDSIESSEPFSNTIVSVKPSDCGEFLWFMLETHTFFKARPNDVLKLIRVASTGGGVMEFVIISDDDGHHYICPADREEEADEMLQTITDYWREDRDGECPPSPDFLVPIGGAISRVKFQNYRIE